MSTIVRIALVVLFSIGASFQGTPADPKPPPVKVSVFEVRASSAAAISTRRGSCQFEFAVVRTIEDAEESSGAAGTVRDGKIGYRCFQGADEQSGKDSAQRLLELLDAKPGEPDPASIVERPFVLGDSGVLRLTILRRAPEVGDLWILERADGRRVTMGRRS